MTCYSAPNICSSEPWWPCGGSMVSNGTSSTLNSKQDLASIPTAQGGLSRLAIARLKSAGVPVAPLLRRVGLTPEVIADPEERLSVQSQIALLDEAAIALKDDCLGFTLARDFDPREIGLLHYVMASSQTLGDGLKRVARYSQITNEAVVVRYQEGNRLIISLSYSGVSRHSDRHQIEFCMFGVLRVCRMLTEQKLVPQHFSIAHHRSGANSEMVRFVGTKVEFGADRDEFALNAEAREFPLIHADPYLNNLLMKNCEAALADRRGDVSQLRRMKSLRCFLMKNARGRRCPQPGNEREDACTKAFNACEAPRHRTSYSTYRLTARAARRRSKRRSAWAVVKRAPATTRAIQLARIGMDQSPMMTVNSSAKWAAAGSLLAERRVQPICRGRGRMSNCVVGSGGSRLPCSTIAEHSVEGCDHFSHDGHDDDLGFFVGGGEAFVEGF